MGWHLYGSVFCSRTSTSCICSRQVPAASKICGDVRIGHTSSSATRHCKQCPFLVPDCSAKCAGKLQKAARRVCKVSINHLSARICSMLSHQHLDIDLATCGTCHVKPSSSCLYAAVARDTSTWCTWNSIEYCCQTGLPKLLL